MLVKTPEQGLSNVIWAPQPGSQVKILGCPLFEVLYHSNRGPGKTDTLLMMFGRHVGKGFGEDWVGIIFRRTFPELGYLIKASRKWFPKIWPQARFNIKDTCWTWPTGEILYFKYYLKEDDYWKYHGHAYPFIGWDELCTWKDLSGYKRMFSCCRSTNPDVPRMIRSTTNPYGPNHNNVKFHFELPGKDGIVVAKKYVFEDPETGESKTQILHRLAIRGYLHENKILLKAQPTYMAMLREAARNPEELAAWEDGDWNIVSGGMFDDIWKDDIHVVKPFPIPRTWRIDRAFDWGSSKPFSVGWYAESDGSEIRLADGSTRQTIPGDLFRINEWYGWNGKPNEGLKMLATDIAKGIIEREFSWGLRTAKGSRVYPGPADSSIFDAENGNCIAKDMASAIRFNGKLHKGIHWTRADKSPGSRKTGWEQTRTILANAVPKDNLPREKPGLFVFSNCTQFLRVFPVSSRDDKDLDDLDTATEDHLQDEVRYRVRFSKVKIGLGKTAGHH